MGFNLKKKGTSRFFIVTIIFSESKRQLEKIARRVHKGLAKKYKKIGTLHAYREESITQKRVLKQLNAINCGILAIVLDKKKVFIDLGDEKDVLYNYIANILLGNLFVKKPIPTNRKITLIASRRETNKFLNMNFRDFILEQIYKKHRTVINIAIATPEQELALQVVDFASWAIFHKYAQDDDTFYKLIKSKIIDEVQLYAIKNKAPSL